jgi:hypothetical protein
LETVPEEYGEALDASLRNLTEIVSLSTAVLVSLERYQGATAAGDRDAADRQLRAYTDFTSQVAKRFEEGAVLLESLVAASRAAGIADIVLTAEQVRKGQQQLAKTGFNDDSLAVFGWLGVSQEFLDEHILPVALRADPTKAAGSYYAKLLELAAAYRWAGAGLARKALFTYVVGNPHDREETIDLFIRRASMSPDWRLSVVDAETMQDGKPVKRVQEVEAGRQYRVQLPAHGQVAVASVVVPVGVVGENTKARWTVEGKIGDELIGGMVHEYGSGFLPDLKLPPTTLAAVSPAVIAQSRWVSSPAIAAGGLLVIAVVVVLLVRFRRKGMPGA